MVHEVGCIYKPEMVPLKFFIENIYKRQFYIEGVARVAG
jgi:hypothetical protein